MKKKKKSLKWSHKKIFVAALSFNIKILTYVTFFYFNLSKCICNTCNDINKKIIIISTTSTKHKKAKSIKKIVLKKKIRMGSVWDFSSFFYPCLTSMSFFWFGNGEGVSLFRIFL